MGSLSPDVGPLDWARVVTWTTAGKDCSSPVAKLNTPRWLSKKIGSWAAAGRANVSGTAAISARADSLLARIMKRRIAHPLLSSDEP